MDSIESEQKLKLDVLMREYDIAAREYSATAAGSQGNFDQMRAHHRWYSRVESIEQKIATFLADLVNER